MKKRVAIPTALALLVSLSLPANGKRKPADLPSQYVVKVPFFVQPPTIDGRLDNPIWKNGAVLERFFQFEPQEGASPSEKTVAYVGYDRKNLFIAVLCFDSRPREIRASLAQRDKFQGDDEITIYLDTFNDKKRAFVFKANPCGVQSDGVYSEITRRDRGGWEKVDYNWDTFFNTAAQIEDWGYALEMAIPFKSLRFPNTLTQVWGFQIIRTIPRKNEEITWYPRTRDVNGFLVQTGRIEITGQIEKGKNIEILPVFTGAKQTGQKFEPEGGLNLKYGITSDLTADMTYNPDFSQIESDIPQNAVNQRYALYYPEKRPFFLEGKDFFDTPLELVYTRKIIDPGGGIKLTGKMGRTTLGFLSVLDQNPSAIETSPVSFTDEEEEEVNLGRAFVNVFRLKHDLFSESFIGLILTDKEMGGSYRRLFTDHNRVGGVDGNFKFLSYNRFSFQVLGSQSRVAQDKTRFVPAAAFNLSHASRHISFSLNYTSLPPGFEAATGFFRRKDIRALSSRLSYSFLPENNLIISISPNLEYRRIYDFRGTLTDEEYNAGLSINGWRRTHIWMRYSSGLERYEGVNFSKKDFEAWLGSAPFSWLSADLSFGFGDGVYYDLNPYLGYKTSYGLRITLKPLSSLRVSYDVVNEEFYKGKGGEKVYAVNIISQRVSYQLSRPLSLRLITDYDDYYKTLYLSILLSYEYRPGTVFYIGLDDNRERDPSGIFRSGGRYLFIKFSYWWRV